MFYFKFNNEWIDKYFLHIESSNICANGENHHIYPKCIFGDNKIVKKISISDHAKAHWLLYKAFKFEWDLGNRPFNRKEYSSICFALTSFNQVNDNRRKKISLLTEIEFEEYCEIIQEIKTAYKSAYDEEYCEIISNKIKLKHQDKDWHDSIYTEDRRKEISDRFKGKPKSIEQRKKMSDSSIGKSCPWVIELNKNPEKIKKTAEKHKGMKRTEETKKNISEARKKSIANKGICNKGHKQYYDPNEPLNHTQCLPENKPEGWYMEIGNHQQ